MKPKSLLDRQLGILFAVGTGGELTDGQLLERFSTREHGVAEQAFETLVHRHGPMVLRACRALLANPHDAEDAFQATFLVLARQAKRLWVSDSIGPWLHQVAVRTSGSLRRANARRRRHEGLVGPARLMAVPEPSDDDIERLVHEELNRLPERFRVPVVLCDLEGQTHEQAARNLGLPVGTVKSRLSRARERLRGQLARRGLAPESVTAALAVGRTTGLALTDSLVNSTSTAALRFITTGTTLGGTAAILAQGVLSAMLMTRFWKAAAILIVTGGISGLGLIGELKSSRAGQVNPAIAPSAAQDPVKKDDPLPSKADDPYATVKVVNAQDEFAFAGNLIPTNTTNIVNDASTPLKLISLLPEGTVVKAGEIVGEFDPRSLRSQLVAQKIKAQSASFPLKNAEIDLGVAISALKNYQEVALPSERKAILAEIQLAESNLQKSTARIERLRQGLEKIGSIPQDGDAARSRSDAIALVDLQDRSDALEQTIAKDRAEVERQRNTLEKLDTLTSSKIIVDLQAEIDRKKLVVEREKGQAQLEVDQIQDLEKEITRCKLTAPIDGRIVYEYPVPLSKPLEPGQIICKVAKADSTWNLKVRATDPGSTYLLARIAASKKVEAAFSPHQTDVKRYKGEIVDILPPIGTNPQAESEVMIRLLEMPDTFHPKQSVIAWIEVISDQFVAIPPSATVTNHQGKRFVAVKTPKGNFEKREVSSGNEFQSQYKIQMGPWLRLNEEVALNPGPILFGPGWKEEQRKDSSESNEENPENAPQ